MQTTVLQANQYRQQTFVACLEGISSTNSMRQLCSQWRGDGMEVQLLASIVNRHLSSFAVPKPAPVTLQPQSISFCPTLLCSHHPHG